MKKQNKTLPPVSVTLKNRADWLWKWVKVRGYSFDSNDRRNTFLYIYFLTWMQAYGNYNFAYVMTHRRNRQLNKPLKLAELDKKIEAWNQPKYNLKFTNETLIRLLDITPEEVDTLKIGYAKKLKEERTQRTALRNERNREISLLRAKGLTQKQIAERLNISISTVKRILREAKSFVKGSEFTINRSTKTKSASTESFVSPEAERLYSLYKAETQAAPEDEYHIALDKLINSTNNVFIQGAAGTGKSTLIRQYLGSLSKEERESVLLLAPTGKAADVIGGSTVHKAFELPSCVQLDTEVTSIPKMLKNIKTLIIDEISMVRADVFEKVMSILQFAESQSERIRIIVVGDFSQLPPVTTTADAAMLKTLYPSLKGYHAFDSQKWDEANFEKIVLHKIMRQDDADFIEHLNGIKYGKYDDIEWFNLNACPFASRNPVYLCSKRKTVDDFNQSAIQKYSKDHLLTTYNAECNGVLPTDLPCPRKLTLGVGVRVMTICNEKNYKNGMVGTVKELTEDKVVIKFDNGKTATVKRKTFELENGTSYTQFPLLLAYAITVHRAQGSTFEHVALICDGCFEAGQLYCLLSRCPSLENITFIGELKPADLKVDISALKMTVSNK